MNFSQKVCHIKISGVGWLSRMKKTFVLSNGERKLSSCQIKWSEREKLRRRGRANAGKSNYFIFFLSKETFSWFVCYNSYFYSMTSCRQEWKYYRWTHAGIQCPRKGSWVFSWHNPEMWFGDISCIHLLVLP